MKLDRICLAGVICIISCAAPQVVDFPDAPNLPTTWGNYSSKVIPDSMCPDIGGQYLGVPDLYTLDKNGASYSKGEDYAFYSLFPFHLATENVVESPFISHSQRFLILEHQNSNQFDLTNIWPNGLFIEVNSFLATEGDFACSDGFIEFPVFSNYGQIEGITLNGQSRRRLRKAKDGSLIVINTFGPYKSRSSINSKEFVHEYFRFRPKN